MRIPITTMPATTSPMLTCGPPTENESKSLTLNVKDYQERRRTTERRRHYTKRGEGVCALFKSEHNNKKNQRGWGRGRRGKYREDERGLGGSRSVKGCVKKWGDENYELRIWNVKRRRRKKAGMAEA